MKPKKRPEIIAPAGDWETLTTAADSGADGVYFGIKEINMRYAAGNFDILEIKKVMKHLHERGKKGYLALNVFVYNKELAKVKKILAEAKKTKVDAVIVWDMAVLSLAKELGLNIHLSTQASVANFEAVKFYSSLGVKRIVLARECTLEDIKEIIKKIKKEKIECDIETFVHGAMCVSISGRCFLSQDAFSKSANRGECLQPCRREYYIRDVQEEDKEFLLGKDYILSPRDLCTIDFLDELIEAGIGAFKIEGRMRPPEYVKVVTESYRALVDAYFKGAVSDKLKDSLKKDLSKVYNRGFTNGFYFGTPSDFGARPEKEYEKVYLGEVIKFYKKIGVAEIIVNNGELRTGQEVLVTGKNTPANFAQIDEIEIEHKPISVAAKGTKVGIKLPFEVKRKDKVFIWRKC